MLPECELLMMVSLGLFPQKDVWYSKYIFTSFTDSWKLIAVKHLKENDSLKSPTIIMAKNTQV